MTRPKFTPAEIANITPRSCDCGAVALSSNKVVECIICGIWICPRCSEEHYAAHARTGPGRRLPRGRFRVTWSLHGNGSGMIATLIYDDAELTFEHRARHPEVRRAALHGDYNEDSRDFDVERDIKAPEMSEDERVERRAELLRRCGLTPRPTAAPEAGVRDGNGNRLPLGPKIGGSGMKDPLLTALLFALALSLLFAATMEYGSPTRLDQIRLESMIDRHVRLQLGVTDPQRAPY